MAVTIRLARHGRKKIPFYRIVAADKMRCRDGRFLEQLGTMDPLADPAKITLKEDRVKYWIGVGAVPSDTVSQIIDRVIPGYLPELEKSRLEKVRSTRAKRRARTKKQTSKTAKAQKTAKTKQ